MDTGGTGSWERRRADIGLGLMLFLAAATFSLFGYTSGALSPLIADRLFNWWFDADVPRVFYNATGLWYPQTRHHLHPIWPLLFTVPCVTMIRVFGVDKVMSLWLMTAAWSGAWAVTLFGTARVCGLSRREALATAVLAMSMATFWFWAATPESWVPGSISLLLVVATARSQLLGGTVASIVVSAFALGTTVTNWPAALIAHFRTMRPLAAVRTTVGAIVLVGVLVLLLQPFVRAGGYRVLANADREVNYAHERAPLARLSALLLHPAVAPALSMASRDRYPSLSFEQSMPGSRGVLSKVSLAGWLSLLAIATADLCVRAIRGQRVEQVLAATLMVQLSLHAIYGDETFLYAMHFAPLLALVVGLHLPRASRLYRATMAVTIVLMCLTNVGAFREAVARTQAAASSKFQN